MYAIVYPGAGGHILLPHSAMDASTCLVDERPRQPERPRQQVRTRPPGSWALRRRTAPAAACRTGSEEGCFAMALRAACTAATGVVARRSPAALAAASPAS